MNLQEQKNNSIIVDNFLGSFYFNDSGNTSCQATVPVSVAGTNKGISAENSYIRFIYSRGTTMVDKQYQFINRQTLQPPPPQMTTQTDASKTGWVAFANGLKTGAVWSSMGKTQRIIILELKAVYLALADCNKKTQQKTNNGTVQFQMDTISALTYLPKMGELGIQK